MNVSLLQQNRNRFLLSTNKEDTFMSRNYKLS